MNLMNQPEVDDTELWFSESIHALTVLELLVQDKLDDPATTDDNEWLSVLGVISGALSMVKAAEEKFRARQTLVLRPPDKTVIDDTVAKSQELAELIAAAAKAKAVAKLTDDLFSFFSGVLA